MASEGKWIEGLNADTKLADAAERIFTARLDAVEHHWKSALEENNDAEPVHQLRVSTRRARAAVQLFGDLLSKRTENELSRILQQLRRAAGAARDWDVFAIHAGEWSRTRPADEKPGLDLLIGVAVGRRYEAQADLDATNDRRDDWDALRPKIRIQRGKRMRLRQRAETVVPGMIRDFNSCAEADLEAPEKLHQLRIAGKRIRYGLELFADVFGSIVQDRLLPAVEEVQDILGAANDARNHLHHVNELTHFVNRLEPQIAQRFQVGVEAWQKYLFDETAAGPARFREWEQKWKPMVEVINLSSN